MTPDADLVELDATAQAAAVAAGEVSPAELVQAAITRIEQSNGEVNAVIHERFDQALSEAQGPLPEGPFRGVPLVLKDIGCRSAGDPYHAGTRYLRRLGWRAAQDSILTQRFRAAGFVIVGRTNTPELAMSMTTEPLAYGPTRNPWDPHRSAGGSSGGSAAAVALRMVPVGHAGDGGGSLRIPASACGLVGLKPSRGRVRAGPDADAWQGLLAEHVVCRSVRDSAHVLDAIGERTAGEPAFGSRLSADTRFRIGILDSPPDPDIVADPSVGAAALAVGRVLEGLGHAVANAHPVALAEPEFVQRFTTLVAVACRREVESLARMTNGDPYDELEPATQALADRGRAVSPAATQDTGAWLTDFAKRVGDWWDSGFDILVSPTLNGPPPPIGWLAAEPEAGIRAQELLAYVRAFNATGQPSISLPLHWTDDGLPIGVQFTAAQGREDILIAVAAQLENAMPWVHRRPRAVECGATR